MSGVTPDLAEESQFDKDRLWAYADALPQRRGFFGGRPTSSAERIAATTSHSWDPIYADGFVDQQHGWRIRVAQGYHHTSWPNFLKIARSANPDDTMLFVNLGLHAAAVKSVQHQWATEASAAQHMTHGYVMQPFLDHYCRTQMVTATRPPATQSTATPATRPPATLVWMTHNDQCYLKKKLIHWPQHWPILNANQAARKAAAALRFPLLDWGFLSRDNASVVCSISDDGVHYKQWCAHKAKDSTGFEQK
jgi:hypothetical protein